MYDNEEDIIGVPRRTKMERVFFKHLPNHRNIANTSVSIAKIAESLNMTRQGVNQWFLREKLPHEKIDELCGLEGSTLTLEILWPFAVSK